MSLVQESRITVAVRVRPPVGEERYAPVCVRRADDGETVTIVPEENAANMGAAMTFKVDCVFDAHDDQCAVYEECVQELVDHALSGSNVTVFTYGQTGSGKTYTILGPPSLPSLSSSSTSSMMTRAGNDGATTATTVTPAAATAAATTLDDEAGVFLRVFHDLFTYRRAVAARTHVLVALAAVELYMDDVVDLLANKRRLKLRETPEEILPLGMRMVAVHTMDDVRRCFDVANAFRATAATRMNDTSSRSHALFFLDIYQLPTSAYTASADAVAGAADGASSLLPLPTIEQLVNEHGQLAAHASARGVTRARVTLADLAGSERVKRSGAAGQAMAEAQAINKSLSTLGTVIHAMYVGAAHVPFRESNLTKLLKAALVAPTTRLLLIGQVAPSLASAAESLSTLRFCHRVKELRASQVLVAGGGLADAADEARYADTLRAHDALTSELRIVAVVHAHTPQRVHAVAAAQQVSVAQAIEQRVCALRDADALHAAARAEEREARAREADAAHARDAEVAAFVQHMNARIDEYERVAQELKAAKKAAKRLAEQQAATHEATLQEAKATKKARRHVEARVAELRAQRDALAAEEAALTAAVQQQEQLLHDVTTRTSATTATTATATAVVDSSGGDDAIDADTDGETTTHRVLGAVVSQASELNRLHVQYIARLAATARQRARARRMKLLSSSLVTDGTLLADVLHFLVDRAVAVAERQLSANAPWSWRDVDGGSRRLLRGDEMHPPVLPSSYYDERNNNHSNNNNNDYNSNDTDNVGGQATRWRDEVQHHAVTFLSSDDSDDENSHHAAESRRRRTLHDGKPPPLHDAHASNDEHNDDDDDLRRRDDAAAAQASMDGSSSATLAAATTTATTAMSSVATTTTLLLPAAVASGSGAAVSVVSVATVMPHTTATTNEQPQPSDDAAVTFAESARSGGNATTTTMIAAEAAASSVHVVDAWNSPGNSVAAAANVNASDGGSVDDTAAQQQQQQPHPQRHRRHHRGKHSHRASHSGNGESANDANNNNNNEDEGSNVERKDEQQQEQQPPHRHEDDDAQAADAKASSPLRQRHHGRRRKHASGSHMDEADDNNNNHVAAHAQEEQQQQQQQQEQQQRERHEQVDSHRDDAVSSSRSSSSSSALSSSSSAAARASPREAATAAAATGHDGGHDANADIHYLMRVYDAPTLVQDLVKFLRGGTVMLKHGRSGKPHARLFWVSTTNARKELLWTTPNGRSTERAAIDLALVSYIQLGCFSKVFRRHPLYPHDPAFYRCFTLGLKDGSRTVDIVADSLPDYEAWVVGLAHLIGVDPDWGGKLDITKDPYFEQLTFFEANLCESNFVAPEQYVTLKRAVQQHALRTLDALQECGNDARKAHKKLGGIHLPAVNERGAVYLTKGELRFLAPGVTLDIFRISRVWILLQQMNLVYDDNFVPASAFGVTRR